MSKLSYSSSTLLLNCQQKYWHYKINKTAKDDDAPLDTLALDIGTAFHACLESCKHELDGFGIDVLKKSLSDVDLDFDEHGPLIRGMLKKYKELHSSVGLTCVEVETKIEDPDFLGYIDAVMKDEDEKLWIVDIKTASTINKFLNQRLPMDRQLNLYAAKAGIKNLAGCKYRVVTKPKLKRKDGESFKAYSDRIAKSCKAIEYSIPIEAMDPAYSLKEFKQLVRIQKGLEKGKTPLRNYGYCESYFRPCEYWSNCHKSKFTGESSIDVAEG